MEFDDVMHKRRSVRHFKATDQVSDSQIREILRAGTSAPSAGNIQPWRFTVLRSRPSRERLVSTISARWVQSAPVIIVVSMDPRISYARYGERGETLYAIQDTAAATENMLLKAVELGLSSCWIGAFDPRAVSEACELKSGYTPVAILPLGFSAESAGKPTRRPIEDLTTWI